MPYCPQCGDEFRPGFDWCPVCRVPLRLWESEGFLVVYQAMSKAMPGLANVPHYHEADLYVCPRCGRYEFFRPMENGPKTE